MSNLDVTIAIPVGPYPHHKRWLREAYRSAVAAQPTAILIVDDMAGVQPYADLGEAGYFASSPLGESLEPMHLAGPAGTVRPYQPDEAGVFRYRLPWLSGVAAAFNACVAMAPTDWVLMLGADDTVEPNVLDVWAECVARLGEEKASLTYWGLPVRYMASGHEQSLPCNAAIVHKRLWRHTGGFPPETGSGAPDCALLSIMIGNDPAAGLIRMVGDRPLYNYREGTNTDTARRGPWQGAILATRDLLTQLWTPVQPWGR